MTNGCGAGMLLLVLTLSAQTLSAQTLAQAEALWKARRFKEANEVFKQLESKEPKNPDYKVRWGRMMLDHAQPTDARGSLRRGPGDQEGSRRRAARNGDPGGSENFDARAVDLAKKALESDPKLVEAQELLARIALEDNNNSRATEEAKKALAMDANSDQGKAILATIDWLADKKETAWDPHTAKGYETVGHFFVLNRRYEEGIQYYRKAIELDPQLYSARSQLGINLMRLGQNDEAYKQLETLLRQRLSGSRHAQFSEADGQLQELRHLHHAHHHPEAAQEGSRTAAPLFPERNGARHGDLREEVQAQARKARAGGSLSRPRGFRRAHAGHAGTRRSRRHLRLLRRHGQSFGTQAGHLPLGLHACGTK